MRQLILASTSAYRRALLERLGLPFQSLAPLCDEQGAENLKVEERVTHLAERKARSLASRYPEALILGSDQIPEVKGRALTKPGNAEAARASLRLLSGKEHKLVTGVAIVEGGEGGRVETAVDVSILRMRDLTDEEIGNYVRRERVLNCAGAYRTEGLGIALFEVVESTDPTAEVGLPLIKVVDLLSRFGVSVLR